MLRKCVLGQESNECMLAREPLKPISTICRLHSQDICPYISNPDQNPLACQEVTEQPFIGCLHGPDDEWNITWANTDRGENDTQRCPGGVDTLGKTGKSSEWILLTV